MLSTKRFIKKTAIKIIVLIMFIAIALAIFDAIQPVMTNEIAMGQMQTDNAPYVTWELYNNLIPIVGLVFTIVVGGIIFNIGSGIYKFIKMKNKENN